MYVCHETSLCYLLGINNLFALIVSLVLHNPSNKVLPRLLLRLLNPQMATKTPWTPTSTIWELSVLVRTGICFREKGNHPCNPRL